MGEAQGTETAAVVVAIAKENGQIIMHNIGEKDARQDIYHACSMSLRDMSEFNSRIELRKRGGEG